MIYNFSAGPAVLPKEVLKTAQHELLDYEQSGMSVMEMSHRSKIYLTIHEKTKTLLREIMDIPEEYDILFLQGGASLQFTMVPLNLSPNGKIGFIDTGVWSKKAITEAKRLNKDVQVLASSKDDHYQSIPTFDEQTFPKDLDYLHITTNNTIEGTAFQTIPKVDGMRVIADMSSNILSNDYKTSDFDLIYAGAQKNIGPSGVTLVIIKKELLVEEPTLPPTLSYFVQAKEDSLYNTPPTYGIYMMSLVLEWLKNFGGISAMTAYNEEKAQLLYDYLEESALFSSPVSKESRSLTNIPFVTGNAETDAAFVNYATEKGLLNLKGHRSVGGMRASLYNAMPKEGVVALIDCLKTFEKNQGAN